MTVCMAPSNSAGRTALAGQIQWDNQLDAVSANLARRRSATVASQERCKRLGTQAPVSMLCGGGDRLGNHLLGC
jgi:hypothetical protein